MQPIFFFSILLLIQRNCWQKNVMFLLNHMLNLRSDIALICICIYAVCALDCHLVYLLLNCLSRH